MILNYLYQSSHKKEGGHANRDKPTGSCFVGHPFSELKLNIIKTSTQQTTSKKHFNFTK